MNNNNSFANRFERMIEYYNGALSKNESAITIEKIAMMLNLCNSRELEEYADGTKEPDFSIKKAISKLFGTNEEWMVTGIDKPPFLNQIPCTSENPMDILEDMEHLEDRLTIVVGMEEQERYVIVMCKISEVCYRIYNKRFFFGLTYGYSGLHSLANLYRFLRDADRRHRINQAVYLLPSKDFENLWKGRMYPKKVFQYKPNYTLLNGILDYEDEAWNVGYGPFKMNEEQKREISMRVQEIDKIEKECITMRRENTVLEEKEEMKLTKIETDKKIKVSITYAWQDDKYNESIEAFCSMLRESGYDARMDVMYIDGQSAPDFNEMMSDLLGAEKVIVFLSKKYKEKADNYEGGVGSEFRTIIQDIKDKDKKYIFVWEKNSVENFGEIIPSQLGNREVLTISEDDKKWKEKLFSKLSEKPQKEFPPVATKTVVSVPQRIKGDRWR